jgi:hypothetical protein
MSERQRYCPAMKSCESKQEAFRVGDRSRGRFATPADSPLHDCSAYSHAHARRESLGFVPRSRTRAKPSRYDSQRLQCKMVLVQLAQHPCVT